MLKVAGYLAVNFVKSIKKMTELEIVQRKYIEIRKNMGEEASLYFESLTLKNRLKLSSIDNGLHCTICHEDYVMVDVLVLGEECSLMTCSNCDSYDAPSYQLLKKVREPKSYRMIVNLVIDHD